MSHSIPVRQVKGTPFVSCLARVAETDAHEGPVYVAGEDALYFTAREGAIKRLALDSGRVSVVRAEANRANGMTLGLDGRLVVCEQGTLIEPARISRVDPATGAAQTVVDQWRGLRLNSPNDVLVRSDGSIWFTDPTYGFLQVSRRSPRSATTLSATTLRRARPPSSPIRSTSRTESPSLPTSRCCTSPTAAQARRKAATTSTAGSVDGVLIYSPAGEEIAEIELPGAVNFTFGGPCRNVLYITTDDAVWAAVLNATGPKPRAGREHLRGA